MRLARKITLAIAAAILAVMVLHAYCPPAARGRALRRRPGAQRAPQAECSARASSAVWQAYGEDAAQQLVEHTISNAIEGVPVRWLWLDVPAGDPRHRRSRPRTSSTQLRDGECVAHPAGRTADAELRHATCRSRLPARGRRCSEFVESIGEQHAVHSRRAAGRSRSRRSPSSPPPRPRCTGSAPGTSAGPIEQLRDRLTGDRRRRPRYPAQPRPERTRSATSRARSTACDAGSATRASALAAETEARMTALEQLRAHRSADHDRPARGRRRARARDAARRDCRARRDDRRRRGERASGRPRAPAWSSSRPTTWPR